MSPGEHSASGPIRAVVSDLCGTLIDFGCMTPVAALVELFQQNGIHVGEAEARIHMGMKRREHIKTMITLPSLWDQWEKKHGAPPGEQDVARLYKQFIPLQIEHLQRDSVLISGVLEALAQLRAQGLAFAITTGCNAETMETVLDLAREQGLVPDCAVSSAQVATGRPAPWMIYHCMELLDIHPGGAVVNIGDTLADVAAGRNAAVWSVGVVATGNMLGLSEHEFARMDTAERNVRLKSARKAMADAGAHYVIDSFAQLPRLLATLKMRIEEGARP